MKSYFEKVCSEVTAFIFSKICNLPVFACSKGAFKLIPHVSFLVRRTALIRRPKEFALYIPRLYFDVIFMPYRTRKSSAISMLGCTYVNSCASVRYTAMLAINNIQVNCSTDISIIATVRPRESLITSPWHTVKICNSSCLSLKIHKLRDVIYIYIYRVYTKEWCGFKS